MTAPRSTTRRLRRAFTLIEMLLVIGIIAVLSKIIITQIANSTERSRLIVARQQQVALQSAVNSWIASGTATSSLSGVRTTYNAGADAKAKLDLFKDYLDVETYDHIVGNTTDNTKLQSDAMKRVGKWIELPTWAADSYPRVNLLPID